MHSSFDNSQLQIERDAPASMACEVTTSCDLAESSKLSCLRLMLAEILPAGEKAVAVSTSTRMLDMAERLCKEACATTGRIDGSTAAASRQALVDAFNSPNSTIKVLLPCMAAQCSVAAFPNPLTFARLPGQ